MVRVLCLIVVLSGCDSLFGIDHIDGEQVTGVWNRQFVYNNANHAPIVDVEPFPDTTAITVSTQGGATVPVDWNALTGEFSFATTEPYRITLALGGGYSEEVQADLPELQMRDTLFFRPDSIVGDATTTLGGTVTPAGPLTYITTTGIWNESSIGNVGTYSVPWTSNALVQSSKNDRIYVSRYTTIDKVNVISGFAAGDVEMHSGANTFDATLVPITQPWCATVQSDDAGEMARMVSAYPELADRDVHGWAVYASPSDVPPSFVNLLAYPPSPVDTVTFHYATPYAGFQTRVGLGAQRQKMVTSPVTLTRVAGSNTFIGIQDSVACESYTIRSANVGAAIDVMLGGQPLDTDGMQLIIGTQPIELSWSTTGEPVDLYRVALFDVTQPPIRPVRSYTSREPRLVVDPHVFETAHVYLFSITTVAGVPDAATGDFTSLAPTFATAFFQPALFVVTRGN